MIASIQPQHEDIIADFWVAAWQATIPAIDFEARRSWVLGHLTDMRAGGHVSRAFFDTGQPIGFYTLFAETGLIEQICVRPEAKGRGIGAALIADAGIQTEQALNLVVNEDNLGARAFYKKLGFIEGIRSVNPTSSRAVLTMERA
jgi:putative acetyltransferase